MAGTKGMKGGGGRRPGSGRKVGPKGRKIPVVISITEQEKADMDYLKSRAIDTNAAIGRELHRLAIAYELAEVGIV